MRTARPEGARLAALFFSTLLALPALAYPAPAGADPNGNDRFTASLTEGDLNSSAERLKNGRLHTHGRILMAAVNVLRGDSKTATANTSQANIQALMNGLMQADTGQGEVSFRIAGFPVATFEPASMSHFYDVNRGGAGLTLDLGGAGNTLAGLISVFSGASWQTSTLLGPHPASTDMCEYHYARAVDWMRKGNADEAYKHLGFAIHYVQDATVPQHVTNQSGATPNSNHVEYETHCDELTRPDRGFAHAINGGVYHNEWAPAQFVDFAARSAAPQLDQVKVPGRWDTPARTLIPLAERLTAGLLSRFQDTWRSENFSVALLMVNRMTALSGYRDFLGADVRDPTRDVDTGSQADFYAIIDFGGRRSVTSPIIGGDDVYPNQVVPNCWFFPRRVSYGTGRLPLHLELWDYDNLLNGGDDLIDIHNGDNKRVLDLSYEPGANRVTGDINATGGPDAPVVISTTGSGGSRTDGDWPKASVQLQFQRWPTVAPVARYRTLTGQVFVGAKPLNAGYVFWRPIGTGASTWERTTLDTNGGFSLGSLTMGVTYDIRPAASGVNFRGVPVRVTVEPTTAPLRFTGALPLKYSDAFKATETVNKNAAVSILAAAIPRGGKLGGGQSTLLLSSKLKALGTLKLDTPINKSDATVKLNPALKDLYLSQESIEMRDALLTGAAQVEIPGGELGVRRNRLGYAERTTVRLRLRRWLDAAGKPITSTTELAPKKIPIVRILPDGRKLNLGNRWVFNGKAEGPVEGAQVKVRALTTDGTLVGETTGSTDAGGDVSFTLWAGTHFEEVLFVFEILSNPINPGVKGVIPSRRDETTLFAPAVSGDDFATGASSYTFSGELIRLRFDTVLASTALLSSFAQPRSK